jgi:hypothetical protein
MESGWSPKLFVACTALYWSVSSSCFCASARQLARHSRDDSGKVDHRVDRRGHYYCLSSSTLKRVQQACRRVRTLIPVAIALCSICYRAGSSINMIVRSVR